MGGNEQELIEINADGRKQNLGRVVGFNDVT
jgi:hypothetical protein